MFDRAGNDTREKGIVAFNGQLPLYPLGINEREDEMMNFEIYLSKFSLMATKR